MKRFLTFALLFLSLQAFGQTPFPIQVEPVKVNAQYNTSPPTLTNGQVPQYLQVDANGNLNVNVKAGGGGGGSNPAAGLTGTAIPAYADYLGFLLGGNLVGVSSSNPLPVSVNGSVAVTGTFWQATQPVSGTFWQATQPISAASLPLPSGAATSANQPALNGDGGSLAHVTNFPATQPISAASLPLPTGAATAANQVTANTSLANIPAQGQAAMAASMPVAIASNQSAVPIKNNFSTMQTIVTCGTTSGQLIAANSSRRSLKWMVTGANDVTIAPGGSAVVLNAGMLYQASALNKQGSSESWGEGAPTDAFQCITASGTSTVTVWEGN